jgi:hypothetical protein
LIPEYLTRGIGRFFAADVTADERDAWTEIRQVDSIAGWGSRNKGVGPAEKANDNSTTFVSKLLDHATLPTRIGAQKGT